MSPLVLTLWDDVAVRGTTTSHGEQVFSVYEFINAVCQKTAVYSIQVWVRLLRHHKKPPFCYWKVSFEDNTSNPMHMTPVMTIAGLQRLLLVLGNKVSGALRERVEETLERCVHGDTSMIAAAGEPVMDAAGEPARDAAGELDLEERKMALLERKMALLERVWALLEKK